MKNLRALPSVDQLLQSTPIQPVITTYGRALVTDSLRQVLDEIRSDTIAGLPDSKEIINRAEALAKQILTPSLIGVINATGVILHTNLGRAPLSQETILAMSGVSRGYSNLEFNLETGSRGSRHTHTEALLCKLTGAEDSLVVNNNAAGVLLTLTALANRKQVVISRSQLVEIGGGFRVPDVMRQSGAKLVEIGTTNRTHLSDYTGALAAGARIVVRAHPSNFKIIGFTEEPSLGDIVQTTHAYSGVVIDDLGSGSLLDTIRFGLSHEPTPQESILAGADVICFSGDKLMGGPQAGLISGRAPLISKIRHHPLARAVRADKTCLAGVTATLIHYLKNEAVEKIPVWQMIARTQAEIHEIASRWKARLETGDLVAGESTIGGGSLPGETLPTTLLSLSVRSPQTFLAKLRKGNTPVIARIADDRIVFDPRTVFAWQEEDFLQKVMHTLS
jgi:L-seryl-tRNA(Ser) seleniumtransferase